MMFYIAYGWMIGTLVFFGAAMSLALPANRTLMKAVERLVLGCFWPLIVLAQICWLIVLLLHAMLRNRTNSN